MRNIPFRDDDLRKTVEPLIDYERLGLPANPFLYMVDRKAICRIWARYSTLCMTLALTSFFYEAIYIQPALTLHCSLATAVQCATVPMRLHHHRRLTALCQPICRN